MTKKKKLIKKSLNVGYQRCFSTTQPSHPLYGYISVLNVLLSVLGDFSFFCYVQGTLLCTVFLQQRSMLDLWNLP